MNQEQKTDTIANQTIPQDNTEPNIDKNEEKAQKFDKIEDKEYNEEDSLKNINMSQNNNAISQQNKNDTNNNITNNITNNKINENDNEIKQEDNNNTDANVNKNETEVNVNENDKKESLAEKNDNVNNKEQNEVNKKEKENENINNKKKNEIENKEQENINDNSKKNVDAKQNDVVDDKKNSENKTSNINAENNELLEKIHENEALKKNMQDMKNAYDAKLSEKDNAIKAIKENQKINPADKSAFRDFINHLYNINDPELINDFASQLGLNTNKNGKISKDELTNTISRLKAEDASVIVANFIDQHPDMLKSEKEILDQYRDNLKNDEQLLAENRKSLHDIEKEFADDEKDNIKKISDLQKAFEQSLELDKKLSPIKHALSKIFFMLPRSWFRSTRTNTLEDHMDKIAEKLLDNQSTHEKLRTAKIDSIERQLNTTEAMAQIMDEKRKTTGLYFGENGNKIQISPDKSQTRTSVDKRNIKNRIIQVGGIKNNNGCYSAGVSAKTKPESGLELNSLS